MDTDVIPLSDALSRYEQLRVILLLEAVNSALGCSLKFLSLCD